MTKHIMIIDDEPDFRYSAGIALRKAGYKISEADNGRNALALILNAQKMDEHFDLLLIDMRMPEMSGMELIEELKKSNISVPIFVISAYVHSALFKELQSKGCSEFLQKPFEPEEMVRRVENILEENNNPLKKKGERIWE